MVPHLPRRYWLLLGQLAAIVSLFYVYSTWSASRDPDRGRSPTSYGWSKYWQSAAKSWRRVKRPPHVYRSVEGLLALNESAQGRHPLYDLIARGEELWREKLDKQSKTLRQACEEYERRYKRRPPAGFDKWWEWTIANNVQLPDEYDQIHADLEKFWAVLPQSLQATQMEWENQEDTFTIGKVSQNDSIDILSANLVPAMEEDGYARALLQVQLMQPVQEHLPPFRATWTAHDGPYLVVAHETLEEARLKIAAGEYINFAKFSRQPSMWASECDPSSPIQAYNVSERYRDLEAFLHRRPKTFIFDHRRSMDPCYHPHLVHLNGYLANHNVAPVPRRAFIPAFTQSKTLLHADILGIPIEGFPDSGDDMPWKDKVDNRLLWRGSNTGMWHAPHTSWNMSQRLRFVGLANRKHGNISLLLPTENEDDVVGEPQDWSLADLNEAFMDVAFTSVHQCSDEAICERIQREYRVGKPVYEEVAKKYKYIMDIDGNGWSSRFQRLMLTNSLVLKSTIHPEWWTDRAMAYVHYVPVNVDYSDLYDILAFFRGMPDGTGAHDDLAEKIATAGREWAERFWRQEDIIAYMWRVYLEYVRVMSEDRKSMDFILGSTKRPKKLRPGA